MKEKIRIVITVCAAVFIGLLISVFAQHHFYLDKWYEGTYINGEDVSGMTMEESEELILSGYTMEVTCADGDTLTITAEEINLMQATSVSFEELFNEQHGSAFRINQKTYIDIEGSYDEELLSGIVEAWANEHPTEDACIEWNGEEFAVTEESDGIDINNTIDLLSGAITSLESSLALTSECYEEAQVTAEDLAEVQTEANSYAQHEISINITDSITWELSAEELHEWVIIDGLSVSFDEGALYDWIEDLCLEYKTVGTVRTFTTHDGEVISVSGGDYGWRIDYDGLCGDVMSVLSGADAEESIDVTWTSTGYALDDETDWDTDNYVEVDISEQMVYVYKDGELAFSCICVTGLPDGERNTTTGVWYIKDKKESYTLTSVTYGYSTPTKYWVRVTWTGIGFHYMNRSDWDSWSPTLYKTAGSHGCINLTLENAKSVYDLVSIGEAVFIHE